MIRLEKHDELVEAMAMGLEHWFWLRADARAAAATALDALLEAVVKLRVGEVTTIEIGQYPDRIDTVGRLILKLEPTR
jgi:hypothetical protein